MSWQPRRGFRPPPAQASCSSCRWQSATGGRRSNPLLPAQRARRPPSRCSRARRHPVTVPGTPRRCVRHTGRSVGLASHMIALRHSSPRAPPSPPPQPSPGASSLTLIMRRTAPLLGCMPTATMTSASSAPTSCSRGRLAEGASPAMSSSESASSLVAAHVSLGRQRR